MKKKTTTGKKFVEIKINGLRDMNVATILYTSGLHIIYQN